MNRRPRARRFSRRGVLLAWVVLGSVPGQALAIEGPEVADDPIVVDVTETSSAVYNANNRNTRAADTASRSDDDWGAWYNRLHLQAHWGSWQAGLRLDSAWYYTAPSPQRVALDLLAEQNGGSLPTSFDGADGAFFLQKYFQADDELRNRYLNWLYPAKYSLGYQHQHFELSLGDFSAQLGQGLVLSVRKVDELANDTTIRGARFDTGFRVDDWRTKLTLLGGVMNPIRIDDASGRYLAVSDADRSGLAALTEAGMPYPVASPLDALRPSGNPLPSTYAPDQVLGTQLETGPTELKLGLHGSWLFRRPALSGDVVRSSNAIRTGSVSLTAPDIASLGAAYLEVAGQQLDAEDTSREPLGGHAVYASGNWNPDPFALTLELKHYRSFFPLQGNVDLTKAREFSTLQYSRPPTTEPVWNDTQYEGFNTCVTGGRLKTDARVGENTTLFAWVGHYHTWAESVANERCNTADENRNRVWTFASGVELTADQKRSRLETLVGSRFDDADRQLIAGDGTSTDVFYREIYLRYDWIQWVRGPYSLQFQGWLRRRRQTLGGPGEPWAQGITVSELKWGSDLSVGLGIEFDENPAFPTTYFNGQVRYNINAGSNLVLFVGQRQGGLRCVSGVCRVFPPFEGARLDATFRF